MVILGGVFVIAPIGIQAAQDADEQRKNDMLQFFCNVHALEKRLTGATGKAVTLQETDPATMYNVVKDLLWYLPYNIVSIAYGAFSEKTESLESRKARALAAMCIDDKEQTDALFRAGRAKMLLFCAATLKPLRRHYQETPELVITLVEDLQSVQMYFPASTHPKEYQQFRRLVGLEDRP